MKYSIDELKIIGIKNPYLYISGWVKSDDYKIIVSSDKRKIKTIKGHINREDVGDYFKEKRATNNYGFGKPIKLNQDDKIITIALQSKNFTEVIATKKNSIYKRVKFVIKKTIHNFLRKCYRKTLATLRLIKTFIKFPKSFFNKEFRNFMLKGYEYDLNLKLLDIDNKKIYNKWIAENEKKEPLQKFKYNPLISIVIPVYNPPKEHLDACIKSILNQTYENFEICLADDCSPKEYVKELLEDYKKKDKRIKVIFREKNGNISLATNSAISIAKGEFIALVDNDDIITPNALYENVKILNKNKNFDLIYSDEDKLDLMGDRCMPHFKADWSPDTLLSINYITHFAILRKKIVDQIGGFRSKCDGAQDYDMFLRFTEVIPEKNIYHVPKILYSWRMSETSTSLDIESKSYAFEAGRIALEDALKRRKIDGEAKIVIHTAYKVKYNIKETDKVSIIIPTKDNKDILKKCIDSIRKYTKENLYEIIIINNSSEEKQTEKYLQMLTNKYDNINIINDNEEFNYSKLNNEGIKIAKNDYILFLNNDIEIKQNDWLETMIGFAKQDHIGAVGVELLYPDKTIQHAGVVLGLGKFKIASHPFIKITSKYGGPHERIRVPYNYSAVTGACMMVSKSKLKEIHGFDEKLAVSYNDVDLCLKLLQKGYYNVFVPEIKLTHYESLSRGYDDTYEKMYRTYNEVLYMRKKWGNQLIEDKFYNPNLSLHFPFNLNEETEEKR